MYLVSLDGKATCNQCFCVHINGILVCEESGQSGNKWPTQTKPVAFA